jgi:hypothetical protein
MTFAFFLMVRELSALVQINVIVRTGDLSSRANRKLLVA